MHLANREVILYIHSRLIYQLSFELCKKDHQSIEFTHELLTFLSSSKEKYFYL